MSDIIKSLLKKKKWTGEEAGRALILNLVAAYKQTLNGETSPKGCFTQAQLDTMVTSIVDREEGAMYNRFVGLNNWISQSNAIALSYYNQVCSEINRCLLIVSTSHAAESEYRYVEQLPAIMTQKQYDETRSRRIEEFLSDENGDDGVGHGIFNLIERAITHFVNLLEKEPKRTNPLKAIKKKYQCEAVTSPRILSRYNTVMGNGYYTLEDGRRSDQMSREEWQRAILSPEEYSVVCEDVPDETFAIPQINIDRMVEAKRIMFEEDLSEEKAIERITEEQIESGVRRGHTTWHIYEEPPEDLTKWEILETGDLFDYYPCLEGEEMDTATEQMEDFKREFSELFAVITTEIDRVFFKGEKGISDIPLAEFNDTTFTFRELYNKDFFGFRAFMEADTFIFDGNKRVIMNGISILRPSDLLNKSPRIDENGYYVEPDHVESLSSIIGLEQFTPLNEDYLANIERLEQSKKWIEEGYYFLLGYNKAIELISERIGIPDFKLFSMYIKQIATQRESLNGLVYMLYSKIKDTDYLDKEEQARKLQVLQDYFQPVKGKDFSIPDAVIKDAKAALKNMEAFRVQDGVFLSLLTTKREEG